MTMKIPNAESITRATFDKISAQLLSALIAGGLQRKYAIPYVNDEKTIVTLIFAAVAVLFIGYLLVCKKL
jgi:hypothetical protein